MSEPIEYIPAYMAQRRYFVFESYSMAKSIWAGKPAPREVSKTWFYWCKWRKWRYQVNPYNGMLVKINKWTRQYHLQENFDNPTREEVWSSMFNTLAKIAKTGKS